ncbi:T9SS type A sorting domain-containing protein [Prolixibacteraceae bacterium JC049]|nr:T9SS type A sorting domain-containing protein [Prolixibacteraceae bacterium JC049]
MKRILLLIFALTVSQLSFCEEYTFHPSTFTVASIGEIEFNSTVNFASGVYTITPEILDAWELKRRDIVYQKLDEDGEVVMDASAQEQFVGLSMQYANRVTIRGIKFINIGLFFNRCNDIMVDSISIEGLNSPRGECVFSFSRCNRSTLQNSRLSLFTETNSSGISVWNGDDNKLINNTIHGTLRRAIKAWTSQNGGDHSLNLTIKGGAIARQTNSGSEDHGIYIHDATDVVIDGVFIKGFTESGSGHAIKLKNDKRIEVKNCRMKDSGIILRIEATTWTNMEHIWIHDNIFYDSYLNSWTPDVNPKAIVIENNQFLNGTITISRGEGSIFNEYNDLAGKAGGVYRNQVANSMSLRSGTNECGNFISTLSTNDQVYSNLALNQPTSQSSFYSSSGLSDNAVDGNRSGNWSDGSVTHTGSGDWQYWQTDLGGIAEIKEIRIYNRTDSNSERLKNFYVFAANKEMNAGYVYTYTADPCVHKTYHEGTAGDSVVFRFERPLLAKKLRIQLTARNTPLSLAEVEVYGKMLTGSARENATPYPIAPEEDPVFPTNDISSAAAQKSAPINLPVGFEKDNSIVLFPNPVKDVVYVNAKQKVKDYTIFNLAGKVIYQSESIGQTTFKQETSDLNSGIYVMRINLENGETIHKKMIK